MNFFNENKIYGFMENRKVFLLISLFAILSSIALFFTKGINFGVDFTGGTVIQIKYDKKAPIEEIRKLLKQSPVFVSAFVSEFGSDEEIIIKASIVNENLTKDNGDLAREILKDTGNFEIRKVDVVGARIGSELREKGTLSFVLSLLILLIYIGFRFEIRFALASILALVHDAIIAVGVVIIFQVDFNLDILAAILIILGYSINDTIVVFDRLREELQQTKSFDLKSIINASVSKTLSRTTLTSITTLFVVLSLYLFGGEILNGFALTLLVGIIVGTYSSIFIASSILFTLSFSVKDFKDKEINKEKIKREKERLRSMYENGVA
jgi:preprotein translocase subunit SecF